LLHHDVNLRRAVKVMQAGGFSRGKVSALQINYSAYDDKAEPQEAVEYQRPGEELVVRYAWHGPGAHGASQRRCEDREKPEQFAVRLFAQSRDDFMEGQIYDGHETEETCKQQNLRQRFDHFDEFGRTRRIFFFVLPYSVKLARQVTSQRIAGVGLTAFWIAHAGDKILHLLRRGLSQKRDNPDGDKPDR
jgi:hypothetical protein